MHSAFAAGATDTSAGGKTPRKEFWVCGTLTGLSGGGQLNPPDPVRRFGRQKTKFEGSTEVEGRALIHGSCGACQTTGRGARLGAHLHSLDLFQPSSLCLSLSP